MFFTSRYSPDLSLQRKVSRDSYETDLKFLTRVSQVYDALALDTRWISVDADRIPRLSSMKFERPWRLYFRKTGIGTLEQKSCLIT